MESIRPSSNRSQCNRCSVETRRKETETYHTFNYSKTCKKNRTHAVHGSTCDFTAREFFFFNLENYVKDYC